MTPLQSTNKDTTSQGTDSNTAGSVLMDTRKPARLGLWVLALGFGGFLAWAAWAPLDEGVPSPGMVTLDTKRKAVQHLSGGIVREVLVREGDTVKDGQTLIRLDDAAAKASFEAVRQKYLGLRAVEARLRAEQTGATTIKQHPDLLAASGDPGIAQHMLNQDMLIQARRAALRADLQALEEGMQGQEGLIKSYQGMLSSRKVQMALIQEELNNIRGLVKDGYAPRNRLLELERMLADSVTAQTELEGNMVRARQTVSELRQRAIARKQEYRKEVESQLADVTREVQSDAERIKAVADDLARTEIKAPVAGQVVGLAYQSQGGVIPPGQKIMDIVPGDEVLLLETRVAPHLIDRVKAGLPVDIRFSSFAHSPQLVVQGEVSTISRDLLSEPQTGATYYLARVAVTPEGMKTLGKRSLQPGMPVEVVFKTGERSLLTYLIHPLTKRIAASMKEE